MSVTLLSAAGASVIGDPVKLSQVAGQNPERPVTVYCWGTFDGNTVTLQLQPSNSAENTGIEGPAGVWFTPADGTFTEAGAKTVTLSCDAVRLVTDENGSPELYGVIM